jgi:hypothetical protein
MILPDSWFFLKQKPNESCVYCTPHLTVTHAPGTTGSSGMLELWLTAHSSQVGVYIGSLKSGLVETANESGLFFFENQLLNH